MLSDREILIAYFNWIEVNAETFLREKTWQHKVLLSNLKEVKSGLEKDRHSRYWSTFVSSTTLVRNLIFEMGLHKDFNHASFSLEDVRKAATIEFSNPYEQVEENK